MHLHPSNVSDYLEQQARYHGKGVRPCSVAPNLEDLNEEEEAEKSQEEGIPSKARVVIHGRIFNWARAERAAVYIIKIGHFGKGKELGLSLCRECDAGE